jgi:integrase
MGRSGKKKGSISFEHRAGTACVDAERELHQNCTGRWIASVSLGTDGTGERIRKRVTGKTRSDVTAKLKILQAQLDDEAARRCGYTVSDALDDWLAHSRRDDEAPSTTKSRDHVAQPLYRALGDVRLGDLSQADVSAALEKLALEVSGSYLGRIRTTLCSVIRMAQHHQLVERNVAERVTVPAGQQGRPSKALTWPQAMSLMEEARKTSRGLYPYLVLCLTTGLSDEEARALRWEHVLLDCDPTTALPHVIAMRYTPVPNYTPTEKTPQRLVLPDQKTIEALKLQRVQQAKARLQAGSKWKDNGLVFTTRTGTALDAANLRRSFRELLSKVEGINPADWTLRELQRTYVARLAERAVPLDYIRWRVGQRSTNQTHQVYGDVLTPACFDYRINLWAWLADGWPVWPGNQSPAQPGL